MSEAIACPAPETAVDICVLKGVGSEPVNIKYLQATQIDFTSAVAPGPWSAKVSVYKADGTEMFNFTSPTRITLGSSGYNIQFQFTDADFSGLPTPAALGDYDYRVLMTPTVGGAFLAAYGRVRYQNTPKCC